MASTLNELLNLKGVVAAGEFSRDGSLVETADADYNELFEELVGPR